MGGSDWPHFLEEETEALKSQLYGFPPGWHLMWLCCVFAEHIFNKQVAQIDHPRGLGRETGSVRPLRAEGQPSLGPQMSRLRPGPNLSM